MVRRMVDISVEMDTSGRIKTVYDFVRIRGEVLAHVSTQLLNDFVEYFTKMGGTIEMCEGREMIGIIHHSEVDALEMFNWWGGF